MWLVSLPQNQFKTGIMESWGWGWGSGVKVYIGIMESCGFVDLWICGFGVKVYIGIMESCGFVDLWIWGFVDLWIWGFEDLEPNLGQLSSSDAYYQLHHAFNQFHHVLIPISSCFERWPQILKSSLHQIHKSTNPQGTMAPNPQIHMAPLLRCTLWPLNHRTTWFHYSELELVLLPYYYKVIQGR